MVDVCFIGDFTTSVKKHLALLFKTIGITISFSKKDNRAAKVRIFEKVLIRFSGNNASLHGFASPETGVANIRYPWPLKIMDQCVNKEGKTNSLKHFGLIAVHEFLHIKGLNHCKTVGCLMAKTTCKKGEGTGYCLGCLSMRGEGVPLCPSCKDQVNTSC